MASERIAAKFEVKDNASEKIEAVADRLALPKRMKALEFAASLRGTHDEGEAISWMEQRGYVEVQVTGQGDLYVLTDEGKERADGIIAHDREMFER